MTYEEIKGNEEVNAFIRKGNANLGVLGFTDHSKAHTGFVAERAAMLLETFGYSAHEIELVKIAGYMHDIGNAVNRSRHAEYGAILANSILEKTDMSLEDRVAVMSAIGNHDESTGGAMDAISAALIIADKTDVRRSRVREQDMQSFDIHDRVNYAVTKSEISVSEDKRSILLELEVDEEICSMYEYFDIFLERMMMSRAAAEKLGASFRLRVNGEKVL